MKSWISILSFLLLGGFYSSAQLSKIHYIPPLAYGVDNGSTPNSRTIFIYFYT